MTATAEQIADALQRLVAHPDEALDEARALDPALVGPFDRLRAALVRGRRQEQTGRLLFDTASAITDAHDIDEVLQRVCTRTRGLLATDMAYVSLNDHARGETYIRTTDGIVTDAYRSIRMPFGTGVLGQAAGGDATYAMSSNYLDDASFPHLPHIDAAVREEGVVSILGTMLTTDDGVIGALMIADRTSRAYPLDLIALLQQIAALAAVALQRAAHVESLQRTVAERDRARDEADARLATLERLQQFDQDLLELLRNDRPLAALSDLMSSHLGAPVALLRPSELDGRHRTARGAAWTHDCAGGTATLVHAIAARRVLGALEVARALDVDDVRLLERGAGVLAAMLLNDERRHEADRKLQDQLIARLGDADEAGWPDLARRLAAFRLNDGDRIEVVAARAAVSLETTRAVHALVSTRGGIAGTVEGTLRVVSTDVGADDIAAALASEGLDAAIATTRTTFARRDLARAITMTERTARAMRALGETGIADPTRDLGVAGLALAHLPDAAAARLAEETLRPLIAYDGQRGTGLLGTARALLDHDLDAAATARVLHVHPNTVRQRMRRIDDLLGAGWRQGAHRSDVHLALRLWSAAKPAPA